MKTSRVKDHGILLEKETYYTLTINQLQLDIICELISRIGGQNYIRTECDNLYKGLFSYTTQNTSPDASAIDEIFRGSLTVNEEFL
jgi:hypothetical protein